MRKHPKAIVATLLSGRLFLLFFKQFFLSREDVYKRQSQSRICKIIQVWNFWKNTFPLTKPSAPKRQLRSRVPARRRPLRFMSAKESPCLLYTSSTLVNQILFQAAARQLNSSKYRPGKHKQILGLEKIDKVVNIDHSPIGRTPRSLSLIHI